jgi:hypothetical protein
MTFNMAKRNILSPTCKTHYAVNLHEALCGTGWVQAAGSIEDVTCLDCKRLLTQAAAGLRHGPDEPDNSSNNLNGSKS